MKYAANLNQLPLGAKAQVIALRCDSSIRRRLQDIGLIQGTEVECLQISPLKDPIAYLIRGAVIVLRQEDSHQILVEYEQ